MKIIILIFTLFTGYSYAQLNTDRPSQSNSPQTLRKGQFQIESGLSLTNRGANNNQDNVVEAPTALFRIGLSDIFELRIQNGLNFRRGPERIRAAMSNLELGMKTFLLNKKKTQIGVIFTGIAPTSSGKWQPREKGGNLKFAFEHKIGESGALGYNLGYQLSSRAENEFKHEANYTLYYRHKIKTGVAIFAEVYETFPDLADFDPERIELNFDAGFTYTLSSKMQLDYSFGLGVLQRMNFHSIGLTFLIQPDPKPRMY